MVGEVMWVVFGFVVIYFGFANSDAMGKGGKEKQKNWIKLSFATLDAKVETRASSRRSARGNWD